MISFRRLFLCSSVLGSLLCISGCAADSTDVPASEDGVSEADDALDSSGVSWGANVLANGGFEQNTFINGVPAEKATQTNEWSLYGKYTGNCAEASRGKGDAKEGSFVMTLLSSGLSQASAAQVVAASPGQTYRLRAWAESYSPNDASVLLFRIEFLDGNRAPINTGSEQIVAPTPNDWQLTSLKATAPAATKFVRVTTLAKRRSDNGCIDIGFNPTVAVDGVRLQPKL